MAINPVVITVVANQNANMQNFGQVRPHGKVARGRQEPHQRVEPFDIRIVIENPLKLFQKRMLVVICEKATGQGT